MKSLRKSILNLRIWLRGPQVIQKRGQHKWMLHPRRDCHCLTMVINLLSFIGTASPETLLFRELLKAIPNSPARDHSFLARNFSSSWHAIEEPSINSSYWNSIWFYSTFTCAGTMGGGVGKGATNGRTNQSMSSKNAAKGSSKLESKQQQRPNPPNTTVKRVEVKAWESEESTQLPFHSDAW